MATNTLVWLDCKSCLVWFYGISTIEDYLMPNLVYLYILDIYDLLTTKLNCSMFTNNSIKHQSFIYILLNDQTVHF